MCVKLSLSVLSRSAFLSSSRVRSACGRGVTHPVCEGEGSFACPPDSRFLCSRGECERHRRVCPVHTRTRVARCTSRTAERRFCSSSALGGPPPGGLSLCLWLSECVASGRPCACVPLSQPGQASPGVSLLCEWGGLRLRRRELLRRPLPAVGRRLASFPPPTGLSSDRVTV